MLIDVCWWESQEHAHSRAFERLTTMLTKCIPKNRRTLKIIALHLMTSQIGICDIAKRKRREKQRLKLFILRISVHLWAILDRVFETSLKFKKLLKRIDFDSPNQTVDRKFQSLWKSIFWGVWCAFGFTYAFFHSPINTHAYPFIIVFHDFFPFCDSNGIFLHECYRRSLYLCRTNREKELYRLSQIYAKHMNRTHEIVEDDKDGGGGGCGSNIHGFHIFAHRNLSIDLMHGLV